MSDLPEWAQSLPEDYQAKLTDAAHVSGSDSFGQFIDHHNNDAAYRGQSIRIPSEDADESIVNEFKGKLLEKTPEGMFAIAPAAASDYRVPDGVEVDNADEYREVAHSLGMTQKAFGDLLTLQSMSRKSQVEAMKAEIESGQVGLRGEWGAAYDQNFEAVGRLLADAPENIRKAYNDGTMPADQLRWLHSKVELGLESNETQQQNGQGVMTPEQAALELEDLKPRFYGMKKHEPGYEAVKAKFERLMALRIGEVA